MLKKQPLRRSNLFGIFGGLLVLAMFSTQCVSYVLCVRYYDSIAARRGTCPGNWSDKDEQIKNCEQTLNQCTDEDRKKVNEVITCIEKMGECKGNLSAVGWGVELASCQSTLLSVSAQCRNAWASGE